MADIYIASGNRELTAEIERLGQEAGPNTAGFNDILIEETSAQSGAEAHDLLAELQRLMRLTLEERQAKQAELKGKTDALRGELGESGG